MMFRQDVFITRSSSRSGFSLVEIAVVAGIIGLLAVMAIPAFQQARINSYASQLANDFRSFAGAFEICALELGKWPADGDGNGLPVEAEPYLEGTSWYRVPPNAGIWDWKLNSSGVVASVGLSGGNGGLDVEVFERLDEILDDGNLATGVFRQSGERYLYVLQQ
ncbi:prepilin-type N-terminal cleavage/methylation domain-containing protein [Coraliomargarita algicola]|uniref:Prepilin-type N-terminal cleavage/methylation domain-containing protein n=1 Tax=Coraliomargarita algicola TaxID=3092156 RepID=A0ABZ0RIP5_9BACT|nr:prepilin-type N-terminal cleavage/methylation domain-containing protein [Coraliomargarita sp. J2-16]WPJ94807.1 prepilin-type N-terminal cleavage/methylation domain-containing protein [Coraliomargarita sp. J2-16]